MSFRKYGGMNYSSKNNIVSSNLNSSNTKSEPKFGVRKLSNLKILSGEDIITIRLKLHKCNSNYHWLNQDGKE